MCLVDDQNGPSVYVRLHSNRIVFIINLINQSKVKNNEIEQIK